MTSNPDPFRHIPHLRDRIIHPERSNFREFVPAAFDERMQAIGIDISRRSDAEREATLRAALAENGDNDVWVFGYGSLMWDPGFYFAEVRSAIAEGYHRSFCLRTDIGRGTPERPGLMAALDIGGTCQGLAYRIHPTMVDVEARIVWRREMLMEAYVPTILRARTPQGPIRCIAFVVDHDGENYRPGLSAEETARYMATGTGLLGSSFDYLDNLAGQFEILGIRDDELFDLRDRCRTLLSGSRAILPLQPDPAA